MALDGTRNPGGDVLPGATSADQPSAARLPHGTGRLESADLGAVTLENGATLPVTLAYRHDGPGPDAPQVLVIHALTGSADAAGDWWAPLIGPGRALDTNRVGVLCANLLGGRYGSTGPTSLDPATGEPYGAAFPQPSARDQARVTWALADRLGIDRFTLVAGGSLGGMITLEVALARPDRIEHVMPVAAPAAIGALAIAWNHIQLEIIGRLGADGLAIARQLAMTTYRSEADFEARFGRSVQADGRFAVSSYLDHQGDKLLERFDPDTYRVLVRIMDGHDVGRGRGGIVEAFRALAANDVGLTGLGIEGDLLYGPAQVRTLVDEAAAAGVDARYRELASIKGHDAFLTEWDQLVVIVGAALADGLARAARRGMHAVNGGRAGAA
ncbi:MAG TPA: alpha/beta fold hydrolase [Candidatus Limnocylindrales bacterium]|nr:alpha/beta fold hydrolase [Candidatus Limnocylindrales bacterium]